MATVNGTTNADRLFATSGNDTVSGGAGADTLRGGAGNDTYIVDNTNDIVDETNFALSNTTTVTAINYAAASADPVSRLSMLSPDGTKLLFTSNANNLVANDTNAALDLFVRDLTTGVTTMIRKADGSQLTSVALQPVYFLDNNRIVFTSADTTLASSDTNGSQDTFIKDLTTGTITLAFSSASSSTITPTGGPTTITGVSADGTRILVQSSGTNVLTGVTDNNALNDVYMKDLTTGTVTLISRTLASATTTGDSESGRSVATRNTAMFVGTSNTKILFTSKASDLITGDTHAVGGPGTVDGNDLFLYDNGTITRVGLGHQGQQPNGAMLSAAITADGTKIAFMSLAGNLLDATQTTKLSSAQVFYKDLTTGAVRMISSPDGVTAGNQGAYEPMFTPDGTRIIFRSAATNLGVGSSAGSDVFVYDLTTSTLMQVNTSSAGVESNGTLSNVYNGGLTLSPDGSTIYFGDNAQNLTGDTDTLNNIYYRDLYKVGTGDAGGVDTVQASVSYTLGANLENLTLTGSGNIDGTGNSTNNTIIGNTGNNTITGGDGVDTLTGGAGNDIFVFSNISHSSNASPDVITDFVSGTDKINVTGISGSALSYGGTTAGANRLWYAQSGGNTNVMVDTSGDGVADTTIRLTGTINLAASDFIGLVTNSAPVANAVSVSGSEDAVSISGNASATDPDSNPLTYSVSGGTPAGVTFNSNGSFSYTPQAVDQALDAGESRQVSFQYTATDGSLGSNPATITITINGANDAPVAAPASVSGSEDATSIDGSVSATDVDVEALTYAVSGATPTGLTFNSDGSFSYAPQASQQSLGLGQSQNITFDYVAHDGTTNSAAQTVTITVNGANDAPSQTSSKFSFSGATEDQDFLFTRSQMLVGFSDIDGGDTLTTSGLSVSSGSLSADGSGNYTLTPNLNFNGTVTINYVVTDNHGASVAVSNVITFAAQNDTPVATDTTATGSANAVSIDGTVSATDVDLDPLSYAVSGATPSGLTFNSDGTFSYVPQAADQELDSGESNQVIFDFVANDGTNNSAVQTVIITVNGANDAPVATDVTVSGLEDDATISGSVSATDVDVEALTYAISGATPAGLTFNSDGTFSYVPQAADQALGSNQSRDVTFQYVANDGTVDSAIQTVTITITGVNDAPVGTASAVSGTEDDVTITDSVAATDADNDPLTYSIFGSTPAGLTLNANGQFSYDVLAADQALDDGESRQVTFQYIANDGTVDSAPQTMTITINGVNDAPVTDVVSVSGNANASSIDGAVSATDADGDSLIYSTSGSVPAGVTLNIDGTFSYTPQAADLALDDGETRQITFDYVAHDGTIASNVQMVNIYITGVNDAPVATDLAISGSEDDAVISGNVAATDVDAETLTYAVSGAAPTGLTFNSDGSFSYTPQAVDHALNVGQSRDVTFQYIANDGTVDSAIQTVTITINGSDDLTTLSGDIAATVGEGGNPISAPTRFTGQITINDVDTSGLNMVADSLTGQYGSLVINSSGQWTYQLNQALTIVQQLTATDTVQDVFTVQSSNGISQQITLTIQGSNIFMDVGNLDQFSGGSQDDIIYGYMGKDTLNGQQGNDTLYGGADQDTLIGGEGNDYLDGNTHIDTMIGGAGNDTYVVNITFDKITELENEGIDTVLSSDSYQLSANIENLTLTAGGLTGNGNNLVNTMNAHALGSTLNGGGGNDILNGNIGNDNLNGGTGADLMTGGLGDDVYFVSTVGDQVVELAGEGIDTVYTLVSYTLRPNVENVILMAADITAFGNVNSNSLTASLYGNTLDGGGGDDTLIGRQGNDVLVGGNGKDLMIGAQGNDRYLVNTRGDRVVEFANEGYDTIESSISWTMEENVEDLLLTGTNDSFAKGNTAANTITGNGGQNRLDGAGGLDRLIGGAGNDSYVLARGYQQTEVVEIANGMEGGSLDLVEFSVGIYADQVWFAQAGNDLQVSVIGTQANVLIKDWYSTGMGIEQFTLRDGQVLNANEVQQLVDQMAAFTPPALGQTELTTEQRNALISTINSTWGVPV